MQDLFYPVLRQTLSLERLESYRLTCTDQNTEVVSRYFWNIQLSEAFYPVLSILEVSLRNQLHSALTKMLGTENWYSQNRGQLSPAEQLAILKVEKYLCERGKIANPGRIIAELNFSFWTSLFHPYYERKFWPLLIKDVFPHAPKWIRERKKLLKRLNHFRLLRNRVYHYEPIWHWPNLPVLHQDLLETIEWMCPLTREVLMPIDRFPSVYREQSLLSQSSFK